MNIHGFSTSWKWFTTNSLQPLVAIKLGSNSTNAKWIPILIRRIDKNHFLFVGSVLATKYRDSKVGFNGLMSVTRKRAIRIKLIMEYFIRISEHCHYTMNFGFLFDDLVKQKPKKPTNNNELNSQMKRAERICYEYKNPAKMLHVYVTEIWFDNDKIADFSLKCFTWWASVWSN